MVAHFGAGPKLELASGRWVDSQLALGLEGIQSLSLANVRVGHVGTQGRCAHSEGAMRELNGGRRPHARRPKQGK